nr:MAG TPA: hypothetical protein [Caudoviricetes sp.]
MYTMHYKRNVILKAMTHLEDGYVVGDCSLI